MTEEGRPPRIEKGAAPTREDLNLTRGSTVPETARVAGQVALLRVRAELIEDFGRWDRSAPAERITLEWVTVQLRGYADLLERSEAGGSDRG